jgi:hypothetical protein
MEPGATAEVPIWENPRAAPFAAAARRSVGQLIADGRIPIQAIIAAIEAVEAIPERARDADQIITPRASRSHRRTRRQGPGHR